MSSRSLRVASRPRHRITTSTSPGTAFSQAVSGGAWPKDPARIRSDNWASIVRASPVAEPSPPHLVRTKRRSRVPGMVSPYREASGAASGASPARAVRPHDLAGAAFRAARPFRAGRKRGSMARACAVGQLREGRQARLGGELATEAMEGGIARPLGDRLGQLHDRLATRSDAIPTRGRRPGTIGHPEVNSACASVWRAPTSLGSTATARSASASAGADRPSTKASFARVVRASRLSGSRSRALPARATASAASPTHSHAGPPGRGPWSAGRAGGRPGRRQSSPRRPLAPAHGPRRPPGAAR